MRVALLLPCLLLAACSASPPPPADKPADKPAAASEQPAAAAPEQHTELRDSMQAPIDKAKAVDDVREQSDEEQRKAVEDAGG